MFDKGVVLLGNEVVIYTDSALTAPMALTLLWFMVLVKASKASKSKPS